MPASDSQLLEGNKVRIGKQIVLPISKAVEISLRGVKVRFWRSLITMSGIILAIAFMVSVWSGNTVLDGLLSPGIRDREVIREIRLETAPFSYLRPDGSVRSAEVRRQRPVRNTVAEVLSMKGYQTEADAPAAAAAAAGAGARGKGGKDLWLVALSLCVAVVGIVNAMLMSVTERFREIGTMKCLGALDSFVVKLFLLESTFLGSIGTAVGVVLGLLLTAGSCLISYWPLRGLLLAAVSWGDVLQGMLVAFVAGTALSVLGAVYPAVVAARMEPVAALRQEA
jgi:ABC-type antimicrobial peptide transport system permease subunit